MKQQTLISMVDYVLLQNDNWKREIDVMTHFNNCVNYAQSLQELPTIADFIPCIDENGVWRVLEEPNGYDEWISEYNRGFKHNYEGLIHDQYQTALNNVKFSGWEVECVTDNSVYIINPKQDKKFVFDLKSGIMKEFYGMSTSYSGLTTLNIPLTERGMEYFNINI